MSVIAQARATSAVEARGTLRISPRYLLIAALAVGALSHSINVFQYPLVITDEGIYLQQAWSVLREFSLSPYTYFYDHAPAGWLAIAAFVNLLPGQFATFGDAASTGRVLMVLVHVASVFFLYRVTERFSHSQVAAVVATFIFNLSPLAIFYQRQVLLDNLMVFWLLFSLYLATRPDGRIVTAIFSGAAFGVAVLSKENAIFFAPVVGWILYQRIRGLPNCRFALGYWMFLSAAIVSLYFVYATLKNELFPTGFNFDLNNPPADHVSLLYTIWWQLHRSQGSILDPNSLVREFSLNRWLPKDTFLLTLGTAASLINLAIGLRDRRREPLTLAAAVLALSYGFYLARGSQMLEFYIVPLLPFLAMNVGLLLARALRAVGRVERGVIVALFLGLMVLHPQWGYVLRVNEAGNVVAHDLYHLPLTQMQSDQIAFIRKTVPPEASIIMDDDIWVPLHDQRPYYPRAHSHFKAAADPDVRDKLFAKDWRKVDYVVMSNKMRLTMEQNNGGGQYAWIFQALDHSERVWDLERGDVRLEIYRVIK